MSKSNQQHFFDNIIHWQQSGLSQKAWCEENNMAYSVFHYWYRRFRNQQRANEADAKDRFVHLKVQDYPTDKPWCELILTSGQRLCFHQPVPVDFIRNLLD